jgi:hypothetical protein
MTERTEVAVLPDSHLFAGVPLDTHYIEALSFIVLSKGEILFELHGGETPLCETVLHAVLLTGEQTVQVEVSHLPRFVKPVIKRENPQTHTAFFIDMQLKSQSAHYGLDTLRGYQSHESF